MTRGSAPRRWQRGGRWSSLPSGTPSTRRSSSSDAVLGYSAVPFPDYDAEICHVICMDECDQDRSAPVISAVWARQVIQVQSPCSVRSGTHLCRTLQVEHSLTKTTRPHTPFNRQTNSLTMWICVCTVQA